MNALLSFREVIREWYSRYDVYFTAVGKFLLALAGFLLIGSRMGHHGRLDSIFVVLILALLCSFLPVNATVVFGAVLILAQLYGISLPALAVGGVILLLVLLVYFSLTPQEGYALVGTMGALALGIPCAAPLVLGLVSGPLSAAAVCFATALYYALAAVNGYVGAPGVATGGTAAQESQAILQEIQGLLKNVFAEDKLVLTVICMLAAFLVVTLIRRMSIRHSWTLAIGLGALTFFAVDLMGCLLFNRAGDIVSLVIGTAISVLIAFVVKFFLFHVDYSRTISVQFEDGDYYYYVKAVPKKKKGREEHGGD